MLLRNAAVCGVHMARSQVLKGSGDEGFAFMLGHCVLASCVDDSLFLTFFRFSRGRGILRDVERGPRPD